MPDAEQAIGYFEKESVDLALLDIKMEGMSGMELLQYLLGRDPWLTAVMMTGYGSIETAVEAIKLGAYDFITKPFDREVLFRTISKAIERNRLLRENSTLKQQICEKPVFQGFVGQSPAFLRFKSNLEAVARTNYTVLVRGESGTGKELTARAIHRMSLRNDKPLMTPEQVLEVYPKPMYIQYQ